MVDIIAPVTDYLPDSILTTRGDLLKRDATDSARFGIGSANQLLKVNAVGNDLEYGAPVAGLFSNEYTGYNAALVTITAAAVTLASIDLGTVAIGDRLQINANLDCTKGGTAGNNIFLCRKLSGTASIQAMRARADIQKEWWQVASQYNRTLLSGIFRVIFAGTLVIYTAGQSAGSNSSVNAGNTELYVNAMKQ